MRHAVLRRLMAAVSLLVAASALAEPAPGLRFAPEPGVEQHYEFKSRHRITIEGSGMPRREQRSSVTMDMRVVPKSSDDAGAVLEVSLVAYAFTNEVGGKLVEWDSHKPPADDLSKVFETQFRPLMGVPVTVRVDATGKVIEVSGTDALPPGPAARKMTVELFSVSGMQRKLGLALGTRAPEEDAKVGLAWESKDTFEMPGMGDVPAETTHTIDQIEGSTAHISVKSNCELPAPPKGANDSISVTDAIFEGTQQWDLQAGVLDEYDGVQSAIVAMRRADMVMKQEFSLHITLVRKP